MEGTATLNHCPACHADYYGQHSCEGGGTASYAGWCPVCKGNSSLKRYCGECGRLLF